jgi:hypothetical protein
MYIAKGHARKVPEEEQQQDNESTVKCYLPHHPVEHHPNPNKVKVVFDVRQRTVGNASTANCCKDPITLTLWWEYSCASIRRKSPSCQA